MANTQYFHKLDVRDAFKKSLDEIFADKDIYDELGCEVYIVVQKHVSRVGKLVMVLEIQMLFNF